jgi:phage baseplate assembly protein W
MDLNHDTGGIVEGWPHVMQSIQTILATRLNTRVFLREFGSEAPALVDAPMNDGNVLALYVAVAEALERWEPRFELTDVSVEPLPNGIIAMSLTGNHRPDAHRGDLNTARDEVQTVRVLRDRVDNWSLAA